MRDVDQIRVMMTRVDLSNTFDPQLMRGDQGIRVDIMARANGVKRDYH